MPAADLILTRRFRGLGSSPGGDVVVYGRAAELAARFPSYKPGQHVARVAPIAGDSDGWEDWPPDESGAEGPAFGRGE
jgi:hypothetical protein